MDPSGGRMLVACLGSDEIAVLRVGPRGVENLRAVSVPKGPVAVSVDERGRRAVVWSAFDRVVSVLTLDGPPKVVARISPPRTTRAPGDAVLRGRVLFNAAFDPRVASDGRACASCHPDARDDGLAWSSPGGRRQTPMLVERLADTAPYGWDGAGSDVEHHLGHTFTRLEGKGLPKRELEALERYITTLEGPPVHAAAHGDAPLARGRDVFFSAGCASCHSPESGWTDGHSHEVGIHASADTVASFDTPSLRFAGGTAPYAHDGRYPTLRALLASKDGPMGAARDRPAEDLDALEAFVRSL